MGAFANRTMLQEMDETIRLRATRAPSLNQLRDWRARMAALEISLQNFVNIRDQFPETVKLIQKSMDGFTPVTVTVTKAQFLEAAALLATPKEDTPDA